jgi:hypothetical protein
MKAKIIILSAFAALFAAISCDKHEVKEAWPGEKTMENTVWSHFPEMSTQSDMYVIIWDYDIAVNMVIKNAEGKSISCTGKIIFQDSTHEVTISDIKPRTEGESVPDKLTGSVSASGLKLKWSCGDIDYDVLFAYSCPADQLGS